MSQKILKFGPTELHKFIEIYRNYECLWDIENANYKNKDARTAALEAFAEEFGVEGFGPKEITTKIKNLRTQYHGERKKINDSMIMGSNTIEIYKPKLSWYNAMDSFLRKSSDFRKTTSNLIFTSLPENENQSINPECVYLEDVEKLENNSSTMQIRQVESPKIDLKQTKKLPSNYIIQSALDKLDRIGKKARLENKQDHLDYFGKYVSSTLRTLNAKSCIHAQDEIQIILSKYKLKNLEESDPHNSTSIPDSPCSRQSSEEQKWNIL